MNFTSKQVASFLAKYKIAHRFSTPYHPQDNAPYHPQDNDQAEINNHTILDSLCKSLDKAKDK